jgi:hypothetical protein
LLSLFLFKKYILATLATRKITMQHGSRFGITKLVTKTQQSLGTFQAIFFVFFLFLVLLSFFCIFCVFFSTLFFIYI